MISIIGLSETVVEFEAVLILKSTEREAQQRKQKQQEAEQRHEVFYKPLSLNATRLKIIHSWLGYTFIQSSQNIS